jgi:hypothetical protein
MMKGFQGSRFKGSRVENLGVLRSKVQGPGSRVEERTTAGMRKQVPGFRVPRFRVENLGVLRSKVQGPGSKREQPQEREAGSEVQGSAFRVERVSIKKCAGKPGSRTFER